MKILEKLGEFYLGKKVDLSSGEPTGELMLYDSKDLVTHGVCVGMTGSGKTGLCIGLLEEAAIDQIPSIIIDPKGDMGNLLLAFPDLTGKDFAPWVNPDEAGQKGLSVSEFAEKQAELWRNGLEKWGQDGERIRRYRESVDFTIYTPGSNSGLPVSILDSFAAPSAAMLEDADLMRERIQATVSGVLQLLGIKADPLQSREHILMSNIIEENWRKGQDVSLGTLIEMIQAPPMNKIGIFDLESFYPSAERFKLAMTLNNLLAAPGFKSWLEGEPLDIDAMLYTPEGKPRVTIFSIAHLSDSERMFFVTLLLGQILSWMRNQSGTTTLRALLYMDEVFGFLPPIGEPPSKKPLLTLLKQARAFGLGVVLSTQNPVDLDYKGLSNTGTWFIGRLQTEQDQERLIDGLTTASGEGLNKKELKSLISRLEKRQFLLHNVHEKAPVAFNTRWVLSYLRGPLTRDHIKKLMSPKKENLAQHFAKPGSSDSNSEKVASSAKQVPIAVRPQLPPYIRQYFAPQKLALPRETQLEYHPYLIAGGTVQIINSRYKVADSRELAHLLAADESTSGKLSWQFSQPIQPINELLGGVPLDSAGYLSVTPDLTRQKNYTLLDKTYESFVYQSFRLKLFRSNLLKQVSLPGESERDFRIRLRQFAHERRDLEMERMKRKYASKFNTLERQINTAQRRLDKENADLQNQKMNTALSVGSTLLGMFFGRRSRAGITTAARSATRISKEKQDIQRVEEKLLYLQDKLKELEIELQEEIDKIVSQYDPELEIFEILELRPKKSDILQRYYGIIWVPFARFSDGSCKVLIQELANL